MRKTILPHHIIVVYSITQTFEDGYQEVSVGTKVVPDYLLADINRVVQYSGTGLSPMDEAVYANVFGLQNITEDDDIHINIVQIYETDHIGRVSYE